MYDPSDNWSEEDRDVECPECGVETDALPVGLTGCEFSRQRQGRYSYFTRGTVYAECPACGHEWEWEEDLTDR